MIIYRKGERSDTRSDSYQVFMIFGYFSMKVYNMFGYFYTSDPVRVFYICVQIFVVRFRYLNFEEKIDKLFIV